MEVIYGSNTCESITPTNIYGSHYLNMCFLEHFKLLLKIAIRTFKINILEFKWSAFASADMLLLYSSIN